jgi:hypothetical protein
MRCGRAAAAGCSPTEPSGPSGAERHGTTPRPTTTQRGHHLLVQAHGRAPRRRPAHQDTLRGPGGTCSVPCSPAPGRHPGPGPAPCRPGWAKAAPQPERPAKRRPGLRQPSCQPATANAAPSPSRPDRGRQATTPPTDHGGTSTRCARPGRPATPSHSGSSARTGRRQRRGHQRPVRPDTWMPRTPGHRTRGCWTSARPVGRTSPRRTGRGGQGNDRPGRRPDILATGDTRWAARPRPVTATGGARPPTTAPR